jgi:pimeloyl-ACP methyl ester carboxylesterase
MNGSPITLGPLTGLAYEVTDDVPIATVVMTHGLGLGPWIFEPWLSVFAAWKLRVVTLTMPGHSPGQPDNAVTLQASADAVAAAIRALSGPVVLMGHSFSGLVAQMVAARPDMQGLHGVVLVCPTPPGQVRMSLEAAQLRHALPLTRALVGRSVRPRYAGYRELGMNQMVEADARNAFEASVPWPAGLVRDFLRRPHTDPTAVTMPMVVAIGLHDRVLPWQKVRLLGDLYEAVVWRYDDLGHMPMLEPGGIRMGRDLARWCASPTRPQVIESEGFGPSEGVGHLLRRARRGELMKRRSAYGQKKTAR